MKPIVILSACFIKKRFVIEDGSAPTTNVVVTGIINYHCTLYAQIVLSVCDYTLHVIN